MSIFDKAPGQNESAGQGAQQPPPPPQTQQAASDDPFDRVGTAQVSKKGIYAEPGVYPMLYVDKLVMKKSRKGDDLFIAEFDVLQSEVDSRTVGTSISWICNLTKHDAAPGNVRDFIATIMNEAPNNVGANEARIACGEQNPCRGRLVRLEAVMIKTQSGNDFTVHNWHSIGEELQKQANELRQQAGFPPV